MRPRPWLTSYPSTSSIGARHIGGERSTAALGAPSGNACRSESVGTRGGSACTRAGVGACRQQYFAGPGTVTRSARRVIVKLLIQDHRLPVQWTSQDVPLLCPGCYRSSIVGTTLADTDALVIVLFEAVAARQRWPGLVQFPSLGKQLNISRVYRLQCSMNLQQVRRTQKRLAKREVVSFLAPGSRRTSTGRWNSGATPGTAEVPVACFASVMRAGSRLSRLPTVSRCRLPGWSTYRRT
jgi:hypothetical protein